MDGRHPHAKTELRTVESRGESHLRIVSGPRGCGKTTWCTGVVEKSRSSDARIDGILCPAVFVDGVKSAIDVITLRDGLHRRLAERRLEPAVDPFSLGWRFDTDVLREVDDHLAGLGASRHIVIDEVGPLEFLHGGGWQAALALIDDRCYETAVVVVRPGLLDVALRRWPWADVCLLDAGDLA